MYIYTVYIGGWRVSPTGKSFRSVWFVHACLRSGCKVKFGLSFVFAPFPFPLRPGILSLSLWPQQSFSVPSPEVRPCESM